MNPALRSLIPCKFLNKDKEMSRIKFLERNSMLALPKKNIVPIAQSHSEDVSEILDHSDIKIENIIQ